MGGFTIIGAFLLCLLVGYFATRKGRSFIGWTLLAMLISPLISGIILACCEDLSYNNYYFEEIE